METQTPSLDERLCNAPFQGGGCVANFTIYHKEIELLFNIYPSRVLSFSPATVCSRPGWKRRWVCTQLGGFRFPGPGRCLKLTLVWSRVVLSSVNLFTRDLCLILDFGQMHLLSGELLLISPLAPGIQFHTFSLSTRIQENLMPACPLHHGAHPIARICYHISVLTHSRNAGQPQHSNRLPDLPSKSFSSLSFAL